ncbi:unnamed protein product [Tilletia controversa]|uniref:Cutinase n=3 Tax=Tilletia TaxID=13289 RepID=A0A8X7MSM8_9BASI|nr:hypothetical protein CF336_g1588 [Tilletia laevis]KAE8202283.1 hypothetical protein CF328_g2299 [Tilletia controversa]KAE8264172.1 hypothetical protein A4X03_0g1137 [Tilletia caries]KAE8207611.1 hypothetical protein CF335_g1018 [Tilletia laevis]KAE8246738.1 hypothetical protein A4X06_0g4897 [Tilletia controversa]
MRYISSLTFTLAALTVACTAASYPHASGCKDYVLISSRGTGEPQGPSSELKSVIKTVFDTLPNGVAVDTVYPADWNLQIGIGANWIKEYIGKSLASCPRQKFALLGYSQGSMVSSAALDRLPHGANGAIKAALFFGNPFHVPQRPGNVDEHGRPSTGASGCESANNPPAANAFAASGRLLDVCFTGDTVCNKPPAMAPMRHGVYGFSKQHGMYGFTEETVRLGADFLIKHLRG